MLYSSNKITAYIRLYNEEKTIIPCLNSIDNLFDEIIIIYSEIDDLSLKLIDKYISNYAKTNITIFKYPHKVYPQESKKYLSNFDYKNSLASYYDYGLKKIKTKYWMKIDADQIYFSDKLQIIIEHVKKYSPYICIPIYGFNFQIMNNEIRISNEAPLNGGVDHGIIPNDKNLYYIQTNRWEELIIPKYIAIKNIKKNINITPHWIHLRDVTKYYSSTRAPIYENAKNKYYKNNSKLNAYQYDCYKKYVLPLLQKYDSIYQNLNVT